MIPVFDVINKSECCGCELCATICPFNAIKLEENSEGFMYPSAVGGGTCKNCGICKSKCPVAQGNNICKSDCTLHYYAGFANDKETVLKSSSGGFWTLLVDYFLSNHPTGYVAASVWTDDFRGVEYRIGNTSKDIDDFRMSKYAQSRKNDIYKKVKNLIEGGYYVLFTGTPCEVAAVREYVGEKHNNLVTVDFLCQGPMPPSATKQFFDFLEKKYSSRITDVRMREVGGKSWIPQWIKVSFENGKSYFRPFYDTELGECLHTMQRLSCYECRFVGNNHKSDITLGDFHGADENASYYNRLGTSIAVANNDFGNSFLNSAFKNKANYAEVQLDLLAKTNPRLTGCWNQSPKRATYSEIYEKKGLFEASHAVWSKKQNLYFRSPIWARRILERVLG